MHTAEGDYYTLIVRGYRVRQMFGRWRKAKEESGLTCPLCSEVSPEGTEECPKCYHQLGKSIIDQDESVSEEVSTSIFDELLAEDEEGDDGEVVDWSKHTFDIDDVTIDVSQYEEDSDAVALSAAPNFAAIEADAPSQIPKVAEELEDGQYELSVSDAPKNVEKFVVPTSKDVHTIEEPTHQVDLVVPLLPKGASETPQEEEPLSDPSDVPEEKQESSSEDNSQPIPTTVAEPEPEPVVVPTTIATPVAPVATPTVAPVTTPPALPVTPQMNATPIPNATSEVKPEIPKLPSLNPAASNGAVAATAPALPSVPTTPALPAVPSSRPDANAFKQDADLDVDANVESTSATPPALDNQMWPWPQGESYDDLTVRRALRQVMESVKGGDLDGAARDLDKLGPHLGDRKEILFHVGVVLKKLGREEALRRMLETARRLHPEDQHVATALTSLGM
tara:strand:+ start:857 stop:2206 length:1350 start_codon:yes stop_codon:yes gene_type:complete